MNFNYEKALGKNIRYFRESRHLTQEALASKMQLLGCDITRSALAKIEVGQRHIYPDELRIIRDILDVPFEDLFP